MDTIVTKELNFKGQELTIDPKFSGIFDQLKDTERELLEKSLLQDGCRDSVIVWDNGAYAPPILDGRNRYELCELHDIPFKLKYVKFSGANDELQARAWILQNQLGRRNLPEQLKAQWWLSYQDLQKEIEARDLTSRKNLRNQGSVEEETQNVRDNDSTEPQGRLSEAMAKDIGISERQAARAIYVHKNADGDTRKKWEQGQTKISPMYEETKVMQEGDEALKEQLRRGEISANQAYETLKAKKTEKKTTKQEPGHEYKDNVNTGSAKPLDGANWHHRELSANSAESLGTDKTPESAVIHPPEFLPKGPVEKFQAAMNVVFEIVESENVPNVVVLEAARKLRELTTLKVISSKTES